MECDWLDVRRWILSPVYLSGLCHDTLQLTPLLQLTVALCCMGPLTSMPLHHCSLCLNIPPPWLSLGFLKQKGRQGRQGFLWFLKGVVSGEGKGRGKGWVGPGAKQECDLNWSYRKLWVWIASQRLSQFQAGPLDPHISWSLWRGYPCRWGV